MATTSSIEAEHPGELQRGLALLAVFDEGDQRDGIAALVAAREVGPDAGSQIDLERAEVAVGATRIEREIFVADRAGRRAERAARWRAGAAAPRG